MVYVYRMCFLEKVGKKGDYFSYISDKTLIQHRVVGVK